MSNTAVRRIADGDYAVDVEDSAVVAGFNPNQPRDGDGKWTDGGFGDVDVIDTPKVAGKKITPAVIYKKHADGTVVATSADGQRRMRWDAGRKKFITEQRQDTGWQETAALTKTAAYDDAKRPGRWVEPVAAAKTSDAEVLGISERQYLEGGEANGAPPLHRLEMTGVERDAVDAYEFTSTFINQESRSPGSTDQKTRDQIEAIDSAMIKSPLPHPIITYRGVDDLSKLFGRTDDLVGATTTDAAFLSTTTNPGVAAQFFVAGGLASALPKSRIGDSAVLRLSVPAGVGAIQITDHSDVSEVLLERGLGMRVVADLGMVEYEGKWGKKYSVPTLDVEVFRVDLADVDTPDTKSGEKTGETAPITSPQTPESAPAVVEPTAETANVGENVPTEINGVKTLDTARFKDTLYRDSGAVTGAQLGLMPITHTTAQPDVIKSEGFDPRKASGHGQLLGRGVYLATDQATAALYQTKDTTTLDVTVDPDAKFLTVSASNEWGILSKTADMLPGGQARWHALTAKWKSKYPDNPHPEAAALRQMAIQEGWDGIVVRTSTAPSWKTGGGNQVVVWTPGKLSVSGAQSATVEPSVGGTSFTPTPRTPTKSWPFGYEVEQDVQANYGDLARESDEAYEKAGGYHLITLPIASLVPTQEDDGMEWGDAAEHGMTGKPFVVDKDGHLFLIDGHHRAVKAGPHGSIEAWVRPVNQDVESPPEPPVVTAFGVNGNSLRRNARVSKSLRDPGAFQASHGFGGVSSDVVLEAIAAEAGHTSLPKMVSEAEMNELLASGQPELMKAFRKPEHVTNLQTGPYYGGVGDQGNGIYAHYRPGDYDVVAEIRRDEWGPGPKGAPITDEQIAKAYGEDELANVEKTIARRLPKYKSRMFQLTKTYGEHISRMTLRPDTDVRDLEKDIFPAQSAYLAELQDELIGTTTPGERETLELWIKAMRDPGRYASAHGIDAYYGTTPGEIIVLNRGALVVQEGTIS